MARLLFPPSAGPLPPSSRHQRSRQPTAATQATDLYKRLDTGQDELYVRWYAKYQAGVPWHHTGVWFGGYNPPSKWRSNGIMCFISAHTGLRHMQCK